MLAAVMAIYAQQNDSGILQNNIMGQSEPGLIPEKNNPGIVSTAYRFYANYSFNPDMPYISPDESHIIFLKTTKQNGYYIFICYKNSKGNWTESQNLGSKINSP